MSIKKIKMRLVSGMLMAVLVFVGILQKPVSVQAASESGFYPSNSLVPTILTVTKIADTNDGSCNLDCSLREAVAVAVAGDTITFDATLAGQTIVLASAISLSKDVIIDGSNLGSPVEISGNDSVRIFSVGAGKNVTIKGVVLRNGKRTGTSYTEFGGAIFVAGNTSAVPTTLIVQNVKFANNSAYSAGAIYIRPYSNVTILDSEFNGNTAQDFASAIYVGSIGNLVLQNSRLLNNTATGNGAVYFTGATTSTVDGNLFEGNSSSNGGAIYTQSGNATLNITRNLFKQNTATSTSGGGGAIYLWNTSVPIQFNLENNTFYGNVATGKGGAIYASATITTLNNNTFSMNTANLAGGNGGGGIYLSGSTVSQLNNNIIADSVTGHDCVLQGTVTTNGSNNLVEDNSAICKPSLSGDPGLEPLTDNGGLTQTMALPVVSSLIDAANDTYCPALDQRGVARPQGTHCDIGAFEFDNTPPTVLSIDLADPNPSDASSVSFTVTFSESVEDLDVGDFVLDVTGLTDASVRAINGSEAVYTVTVNTGAGSGTLRLDIPVGASITDKANIPLSDLPYVSDRIYTIDKNFPEIDIKGNNISIADGDSTPSVTDHTDFGNAEVYNGVVERIFTIGNSGLSALNLVGAPKVVVSGANASDFSVSVEPSNSVAVGEITTFTISFDPSGVGVRTASISIVNNDTNEDPYNFNVQGTGVNTPPTVSSILRNDVSPTNASSVVFTVNFSAPVTGVDINDFTLNTTGVTGSSVSSVTGVGAVYTVTVNTGNGNGTIRLNIPAAATIVNGAGTQLGGLPYQSGQSYTIDKTAPTVLSNSYYGPSPTYYSNIQLLVNFSEVVTNVDLNDFSLTTTGVQGASITNVSGASSSFTVYINTGTGDGTIRVDVPATATITDGVGNPIGNLPFTTGTVIQIARSDQSTDAAFLDGSFGNNGRVISDFGKNAIGQSAVLQPDGKILVAGAIETINMNSNVLLARYNVDGSADASFGVNGFVSVGAGETSKDITLQSDGKIVVLALLWDNGISSIVLSRYTSNGDLDTTFGVNGLVSMDFLGVENASSVMVQEDGKILVAGNRPEANGSGSDLFLLRYNENGTLDSTFDVDGIVVSSFGAAEYSSDAVLQIDNKIVVVGQLRLANSSSMDLLLTRYNSDGSLDMSFGANGLVVADFGANESGNSIALQPDGKMVISGVRYPVSGIAYKYLLARFNNDGSLDSSFGTNGQSFVDAGNTVLTSDVGLQPDGTLVMLGNANDNFVLYHFDGNGILNSNYGTNGYTITDFGKQDVGYQLLIQPDGKPLAVGLSVDNEIYSNKLVMARYKPLDTPPAVLSSLRASPDPTAAASVDYTVTFSESVTGVDAGDFYLTTSGVTGASIATVTGSGSSYTVKVNTGSGNGTIRLDVKAGGIFDSALNPLDPPFITGHVYTVAKTSSLLVSPANDTYLASTKPVFTWKTITGALEYQLQVDETEWFTTPEVNQSQPSGTTYTSPELDYGTHYWRMRVRTSGGWGVWTAGWKFTLTPALPAAPTLASPASAAVLADNTPLLAWNMVLADDRYEVQVDNLSTFASPEQTFTTALDALSYTATTLPDGVWYWRVRAINYLNLPGAWSTSRSFTVDTVAPPAPALSAPADDATIIGTPAFSWAAAATATKYQFEYDSDQDFSSPDYTSAELTTTSHTPPAIPLGSYSWHVRGKDAAGNWSAWSAPRVVTILSQIPVAPTLGAPVNAFATNDATPEFSWLAVASGNTYQLEISNASTFATKQQTFTGGVGVLNYTATTIPDGVWYWHVRAVNVDGAAGAWSAYRSFTIDTAAPVTAPALSAPANAASVIGTPAFSWSSVATAAKYEFQYDDDADFSSPVYTSAELTTLNHTPPAMVLDSYSWRVRARDAVGNWSAWSTARTITILPPVPVAPALTSPAASVVTNDSTPDFVWASVVSGDTYQLEISNASTFATKQQTFTGGVGVLNYTATTIPDGVWYWHVRALNVNGVAGAWSAYRSFTVDTTGPVAPVLSAPANAAAVIGTPAFSWAAAVTASKYQFEYDNDADFSSPIYNSGDLTTTSHTPPAMALGLYSWHVRAKDAAGNWGVWSAARTVTILPLVPVAPTLTSPAASAVTNDSTPDFVWAAVASGETYQLEISNASTFATKQQTFTGGVGVLSYTATPIPDGVWYWHVRAVNVNGVVGAWSAYRSFTVDTNGPSAPTLSAPANAAMVTGTPAFSWAATTTAVKYQFEYDNDADFSSPIYNSGDLTTTSHTPPAMALGLYSWHVRARDAAGNWGPWSLVRTITILPLVPVAPTLTSPAASAVTNDSTPDFVWASVASGDTYQLEISNASTFATKQQTFSGGVGVLNYTATTIPDGVWYWHVRAVNVNGTAGAWSAYRSFTVDTTAPAAPTLSAPANAASVIGTAAFSWTSVTTAAKYQFEYDNDADFSSPIYNSGDLTTTSHTPPAMALGSYSWHARAKDAAGNWSAWSAARTVTILSTIPVAPVLTAPAASAVTNDSTPDFTWASVTAGDTYQLEISNASTFATKQQTFSGTPGVLTYTATTIPDGVWYWHVRAVNVNGTAGPWSAYRSFTVDTVAPAAPTLSAPANAASVSGTPAFSWASVATAAKYQFEYDNDADFSSPVYSSGDLTTISHTPPAIVQGVYSWHARAKDAAGNWGVWSTARTVTVFPLVPATPTLTSPAYGTLSRDPAVTLAWAAMPNAATYQVQVDNNSTFSSPEFDVSTADTSILTTELPDGAYYWRVRQTDILGGVSLWSTVWRVTIIRPTPNAPTADISAIVDATGTPTFAWNSVQYGVNYILEVDDNSNFTNPIVDDLSDTLSRSFVAPFTSGQYYWRVRAVSEYGIIGPWSTTWTLTVDLIPSAPTLLLPADSATSSNGDPSFSWQSTANADEYQIQVDDDMDFSSPEFDNTAPQTTRGLPAALTDGTYLWRVRGINALGTSGEWSLTREFTVDIPPAAPALLTPEADSTNTDGLPMLSWEAVAGSFAYEIQVDDNANFSSPVHTSTVDASMREVVLALGNDTYYWRIRAINIMGTPGAWSEVWTFVVDIPIGYP